MALILGMDRSEPTIQPTQAYLSTVLGGVKVEGPPEVLNALTYAPQVVSEDELKRKIESLLSVKLTFLEDRIRIERTSELKKNTADISRLHQRLALTVALADLRHTLPLESSPLERAKASLRAIQAYLVDFQSGLIAQRAVEQGGSYTPDFKFPLNQLATELVLALGADALVAMPVGQRVVYSTKPTSLQTEFPSVAFSAIATFKEIERQFLNIDLPLTQSDDLVMSVLADYRANLANDPETDTVVMHVWRGGPRYFHVNVAAYSSRGTLRGIAPVLLDARESQVSSWARAVPEWVERLGAARPDTDTFAWTQILSGSSSDAANTPAGIIDTLTRVEPSHAILLPLLDAIRVTTRKEVWAWLPDSSLDGARRFIQEASYDARGFLTWLIQTGRVVIEENDSSVILSPADPDSAFDLALTRKSVQTLARAFTAHKSLLPTDYVDYFAQNEGAYYSVVGNSVLNAVKKLDPSVGFDGFRMSMPVAKLLSGGRLLDQVLKRGTYSATLNQIPFERRRVVNSWLAVHPTLGTAAHGGVVPDILRNGTVASPSVPGTAQVLYCGSGSEPVLFVDPFNLQNSSERFGAPPLNAPALGYALGNLVFERLLRYEDISGIVVRVADRPIIVLELRVGSDVVFRDTIRGHLPKPGTATTIGELQSDMRSSIFGEVDKWIKRRAGS